MRDTSDAFATMYKERLAQLSSEEQVKRGLRMFDFARTLARSGILHEEPHLTDVEVEKKLFLRFYGRELPQAQIERVLRGIDERRLGRTRIIDTGTPDASTAQLAREQ